MPDSVQELVRHNIRRIRKEKGWTQEYVASRSGLSRRYIVRIEAQGVNMTTDTLQVLADTLEVHPSELFEPSS